MFSYLGFYSAAQAHIPKYCMVSKCSTFEATRSKTKNKTLNTTTPRSQSCL